jgi:hypothetical protein
MSYPLRPITLLDFGAAIPEITGEDFIRAAATLSYSENFINAGAVLEKRVEIYMQFAAALQLETESYIRAAPSLQREAFPYIKFELAFPAAPQRYVKATAALQGRGDRYLRAAARFAHNASYLKVKAALVRQSILGDVNDGDLANKLGLLSRTYVSVVSVKREI